MRSLLNNRRDKMFSYKRIVSVMLVFAVGLFLGSFAMQSAVFAEEQSTEQSQEVAAPQTLDVNEYAFCEGVENREPVGKKDVFSPQIGKVYLWTVITGANEPTEIKHVWYHGEEKMAEIPLNIKYPRSRTWSCKTIISEWTGDWHVDIIDSKQNLIKKVTLKIEDSSENKTTTETITPETPASTNPE